MHHPNKKEILSLTGLRAWASLWVVLFHTIINSYIRSDADFGVLAPFMYKGYFGVDTFFILSGFILSYSYNGGRATLGKLETVIFLKNRIARIYPVHIFVLLVFVLYVFASLSISKTYPPDLLSSAPNPHSYFVSDFFLNLLNIQAWEIHRYLSWNFAAWSLSAEWFAYLTFPALLFISLRLSRSDVNVLIIGLMLLGLYELIHQSSFTSVAQVSYHLGLVRVMAEFSVGCCLYNIYRNDKTKLLIYKVALPVILALLYLSLLSSLFEIETVGLLAALIYVLAKTQGDWLSRVLFANPVMLYLGNISYSVYMIHSLPLIWITALLQTQHATLASLKLIGNGAAAAVLFSSLLLGAAIYHFVEIPARSYIRNSFILEEAVERCRLWWDRVSTR